MSVKDAQTFKDSAEGMLDAGGFNGEGTHTLVRDGGPSQTAYLMSSVVDLDQFVGKKSKSIWTNDCSEKSFMAYGCREN